MILSMGFPSEAEVRRALRMAKNDLSDAVAILTDDHPVSSFDALEDVDIDMKESQSKAVQGPVYGPSLPPSYEEVVEGTDVSCLKFEGVVFPCYNCSLMCFYRHDRTVRPRVTEKKALL